MRDSHQSMERQVSARAESLGVFIEQAIERLQRSGDHSQPAPDGLLFLGAWNDSIPRMLIRDPILKPTEVRLWSVIRTLADPSGPAAMPDYDTLAVYSNVASRTTVSNAILILRITRWVSLCAKVRDNGGRYAGNVYALHDEPITLGDAMYLDSAYVSFLREMTGHGNPRVRRIARGVLDTIEEAIEEGQDVTRDTGLHIRAYQRLTFLAGLGEPTDAAVDTPLAISQPGRQALREEAQVQKMDAVNRVQKMDMDGSNHVQKMDTDDQDKEKQQLNIHVQKMDTVSCSSSNKKTTTTKGAGPDAGSRPLTWPKRLSSAECALVLGYFAGLDDSLAQDVLDELQGRLQDSNANPIRNPVAWLIASSKRAANGEFQLTSLGLGVRRARSSQAALAAQDAAALASPPVLPDPSAMVHNALAQRVEAMRLRRRGRVVRGDG
jgi:hypothetical protein